MKRGALVAAILGSSVVAVDATVVNVALPAIADELGGGLAGQQWVANAYLLTLGAFILVSGSLSDLYGERRVFTIGVAGFGVASMLCALAPTVELLVVARGLQGVAGALLTPASLAIIVAVFPESERGAAIGSWTAWGGIGYLLGPILGGQIVDAASWRWVFALNVPLVLLTLVSRASTSPPAATSATTARGRHRRRAALAAGLAGISFGLIEQPMRGRSDPFVIPPLLARRRPLRRLHRLRVAHARADAAALAVQAAQLQRRQRRDVRHVRRDGGPGVLPHAVPAAGRGLQRARGGQRGAVPTLAMFLLSRRFGGLSDRYGPRLFMSVGPLFVAAGFAVSCGSTPRRRT